KPEVVLYGESLDDRVIKQSIEAIQNADVLIVGGTSLVVYPAAGFVHFYRGDKLVLINLSETGMDSEASLIVRAPIGEVLGEVVGV
ncbi:MAG: NAD-dependent protein deacylase, partial [Clostridia bacterium]|nr:NAD-dependent protein deacylase [Clostridia bacterium]